MSSGVLLLAGVRFRAIMSRLPAWFSCTVSRAAPDRTVRDPDRRRTLIIVTTFLVSDRAVGKPFTTEATRRLYLESASTLIVEVTRAGVLGGPAATTRSIYRKG